jgi:ubiquinone/menaquinone biosynthesis C-methylase UbiE
MGGAPDEPRFIDRFSDRASLYRQARPTYPERLFETLASLAPGRDLAWDCGAGSGQAAVSLAHHFARVHASEPSRQQLAEAEQARGITYHCERAEDVAVPDQSVDLAVAAQALHWFDLDLYYAQVRRVLKPGGIVAAIGYDWMYVDEPVDAVVSDRFMPRLAPYWAPQNALLWAGYRSIPFPGEEVRLGAFAIHLDWKFEQVRNYILSWSAARAVQVAAGFTALDDVLDALEPLWGERRHVTMPLFVRAARLP